MTASQLTSTTSTPPTTTSTTPDTIGSYDVLCGRGGATNTHIGNRRFRTAVADLQDEYLRARKKEKVIISKRIVSMVHANGGRFLKRCNEKNIWVEVPIKKATEKTSQALRENLDIRNRTVRAEKMSRRFSDSSEESPRKRARLVEGTVAMVSPELTAIDSGASIPELRDENPTAAALVFLRTPPPRILQSDCSHVEQV